MSEGLKLPEEAVEAVRQLQSGSVLDHVYAALDSLPPEWLLAKALTKEELAVGSNSLTGTHWDGMPTGPLRSKLRSAAALLAEGDR